MTDSFLMEDESDGSSYYLCTRNTERYNRLVQAIDGCGVNDTGADGEKEHTPAVLYVIALWLYLFPFLLLLFGEVIGRMLE